MGGGGAVWDGISYDPDLHLIYIGTANPAYGTYTADDPFLLCRRQATGVINWSE